MHIRIFVVALLILGFGSWFAPSAKAQDAVFSQFYAASLYLNPAMAGRETDLTFNSNYRTQWRNVSIPYTTTQLSIINPFHEGKFNKKQKGGMGVSVFNDRAGTSGLQTLGIHATGAYNIEDRALMHMFSVGGQVGFIQKSLDYSELEWGSQYNGALGGFDPTAGHTEADLLNSKFMIDANVGAMYYYNPKGNWLRSSFTYYIGAAGYHLNQPDESMLQSGGQKLPMLIKAHGGMTYHASDKINISPHFLVAYQQARQINVGSYVEYRLFEGPRGPNGLLTDSDIILGGWYRFQDAFIFNLGIGNSNMTIGISYDMNASSLRRQLGGGQRGAYEFTLQLRNSKSDKHRKFDTPRI